MFFNLNLNLQWQKYKNEITIFNLFCWKGKSFPCMPWEKGKPNWLKCTCIFPSIEGICYCIQLYRGKFPYISECFNIERKIHNYFYLCALNSVSSKQTVKTCLANSLRKHGEKFYLIPRKGYWNQQYIRFCLEGWSFRTLLKRFFGILSKRNDKNPGIEPSWG